MLALLLLILVRPFISSLAYPKENLIFSFLAIAFITIWLAVKNNGLKKIATLRYPFLLLALALTIVTVFSPNKLTSIKEIIQYGACFLFFVFATTLEDKERKQVLFSIVSSGLLISISAIYQYYFGFQHALDYLAKQNINNQFTLEYITRKRAFFPFVTPNALGGFLAMIIPLAAISKNKILLIIPLVFALFLTKSLGVILSLLLGIIIYFLLVRSSKKKLMIFSLGFLVILIVIFLLRTSAQKQHLQPIFSTLMRINYWQETWKIIKNFPLLGVGPGNFNLAQSRYSHNSYLQIWAEMGILGLLSFLWFTWAVLNSALKKINSLNSKKEIFLLITAYLVFLLHNFIDFTFFLPEVSCYWWIIAGLLVSA
ncbi:MAG: O-antigen ligase family protein [Candidatus Omnitrophica bacterium]|nr:O-antigen ligase family protein [Candidatus Omnitrophota bacterium]